MFTKKIPIFERFIKKVKKTNSCWIWMAHTTYGGYGALFDGYKGNIKAHRFSYEYFKGKIPKNMCVLHKCDNPSCVNPEHLFLGTQSDNILDMIKKGRKKSGYRRGENNNLSKFSNNQIKIIRYLYKNKNVLLKEFSQLFNVDSKTIGRIIRKETYSNV